MINECECAPVEKLERSFQHHRLVLVGCAPVGHTCIDHDMRVRCRMPSALRHSVEMNEHEQRVGKAVALGSELPADLSLDLRNRWFLMNRHYLTHKLRGLPF